MTSAESSRRLAITGTLSAVLTGVAAVGVFLVAPEDADQGIIQKIFYFHVAIAVAALLAFSVACIYGIRYLRSRDERFDEVSSILIGIGLGLSVLVVVTGSIWAKASWGTWWVDRSPPRHLRHRAAAVRGLLRAALLGRGERRARYCAVYSVAAFASVPLSFYSVRVARSFVHPVVFTENGANMSSGMLTWFVISQLAVIGLFLTILQLELIQRRADRALRRVKPRLEAMA